MKSSLFDKKLLLSLILCHIAFQHIVGDQPQICGNYVPTSVLPWQRKDKKIIHRCFIDVKLSLVGPTMFKSPLLTEIGYDAYPRLGGVDLDDWLVSTNWSLWGRLFRFLLVV